MVKSLEIYLLWLTFIIIILETLENWITYLPFKVINCRNY